MSNDSIRVVHSLAGAEFGGAENYYTRQVCALANEPGFEQHAFTRVNERRVSAITSAGVPVQTFRFGGKLDWIDHWQYRRALRSLSPDVVLTYMNRASGLTPSGNYQLICRLGHYYDLKYYRHADYWVGITRGICDHIIAGGMSKDRVVHIPNFADEAPCTAVPRNSFNTLPDQPIILAAGRLHTNKGFDILLKAMTSIPDATLWLAGDGPEYQALRDQSEALNIQERIRFLGWRTDVNSLMETADLFVCPSRHEGLGSIIVESWLHNCPLVATASQGPGELIDHETTGLLTPIDDVDALAGAIKQVLDDNTAAQQMAERACQHYSEHYSQKVIVSQYCELFRRAAESK